ncbi:MAG: transcriptional repressor [Rhodospirillaceae bacterium]|nr:transcriptional repressor [Rhodospirillaceae bacterium]
MSVFAHHTHDYASDPDAALEAADQHFLKAGVRFTPLRRRVFEIILRAGKPIGAYDILERLRDHGKIAAPISVYRVLDFLIEQRFVHRLATINAYMACVTPEDPHAAQFLICQCCGSVTEISDPVMDKAIADGAKTANFQVSYPLVEIMGICADCSKAGKQAKGCKKS